MCGRASHPEAQQWKRPARHPRQDAGLGTPLKKEKPMSDKKKGKPEGESKYALKVKARKKAAKKVGLDPKTATWPLIWAAQGK
jgi:hypothetical protein